MLIVDFVDKLKNLYLIDDRACG